MSPQAPLIDPAAIKEEVAGGFTAAADGYDTTGTEFFQTMGERLVAHAGVRPGAVVLDAGCGKGAVTMPAARAAGPDGHVTGLDLTLPMLEHAKLIAVQTGLTNITFEPGDAEEPPFAAGSFDVILAGNVMQFLPRPATALRRWRTLLAPGGALAVSWGLAEDPRWTSVIRAFDVQMPDGMPGFKATMRHPPFATVESLEQLLAHCWYAEVATVMHEVTMTYTGTEQWWAACQSQAPWAVCWRHIPDKRLTDAKQEAFALLEGLCAPDAQLTRTLAFACTRGMRRDVPEVRP